MKNFITCSFTILLVLTCLIAFPIALNEITGKAAGRTSPMDKGEFMPVGPLPSMKEEMDSVKDKKNSMDASMEKPPEDIDHSSNTDENKVLEDDRTYNFMEATSDYFNDALFIGDSRTVGLSEYGNLGRAAIFASNGMNVYNVFKNEVSTPAIGKMNLEQLLESRNFDKIYIMLGINELGYDFDATKNRYFDLVNTIKTLVPDAIIFIQANLHVTQSRSDSDEIYNNINIDKFNDMISTLADNKTIFYIDVNEIFDDEHGNLHASYSADNTHVLGKYYDDWSKWLCKKAIRK